MDPFADAWPVVEGWLAAEPSVSAKVMMERLANLIPDMYASKTQLRTLQRRVKVWRVATNKITNVLCKCWNVLAHNFYREITGER